VPRFLLQASYTAEGVQGIRQAGGTARRDAVAEMAQSLGGRMESFDFAFGEYDVYTIVDLPDQAAAAAAALEINASGAVALMTTVLMTPEDVDEASRRAVSYRPPGA
jgi:uncharacterized protein with GYD domain